MTQAALPRDPVPFAKAFPGFYQLGQAGQQMWEEAIFPRTGFGAREIELTVDELARACGRGRRWAHKALRQLLDFALPGPDGEPVPLPAIGRERRYGPKRIAGVITRIIVPFLAPAEPDERAEPAAPERKPRGGAAASPVVPNVGPIPATTPEQAAAAAARVAEATASAPAEEAPETPEERKRRVDAFRESIGLKPPKPAPKRVELPEPPAPAPGVEDKIRATLERIQRRLGGAPGREGGPPPQPAGP